VGGMKESRGRYIVTLDADLQNDPRDIPEFIKALEKADCVCGSRVGARGEGDNFVRIASSRIANWVRNNCRGKMSPMPAAATAPSNASAWQT